MAGDLFVNQAYLSVVESAANTLTFSKLETGISLYEKVAWVISRLDYEFTVTATQFGATDDTLFYGISASDQLTTVPFSNSAVVDRNFFKRVDLGTAGTGNFLSMPRTKTFADLPGGGLIVPPNPLYIFAQGSALASAVTVSARMFYTVKVLKTEEFWELVEQRRMIGV